MHNASNRDFLLYLAVSHHPLPICLGYHDYKFKLVPTSAPNYFIVEKGPMTFNTGSR